ncbi:hypothetical protein [Pseudomonas luteola]|uniref:hypothetical protein n=1 Tax=Pseudomonas luteola TaxID=47886 RepID=UPI00123853D0|nr:hypothetical protein [Pseudomonas luteola]QEU29348.1 hypothetical protein FOB45_16900 [Pseudomonas luteola]
MNTIKNASKPANISVKEHNAMLAQLAKNAREIKFLQRLVINLQPDADWIAEAKELRARGYTFGQIAGYLGLTRQMIKLVFANEGGQQ